MWEIIDAHGGLIVIALVLIVIGLIVWSTWRENKRFQESGNRGSLR